MYPSRLSCPVALCAALLAASCHPGRPASPPGPSTSSGGAVVPGQPAAPGEPPVPTVRLPAGFTPARYRAQLSLDPARDGFAGAIEIDGALAAPSPFVWLDAKNLKIRRAIARVGGRDVALDARPRGDFLLLVAAEALPAGELTLALDYDGRFDADDTYGAFVQEENGARYVFSNFEPEGAREVFPSVDEPWSKVPWTITLDVPKDLVAVSNALVAQESAVDDTTRRVVFAETTPLPTYLIAFGVGPFDVVDAGTTAGGAPIRIIAMKGRAEDAAWAAEVTPKIIAILEAWFGTPYPYPKADAMAIPSTVGFGAMENAGLITYRESALLLDPKDKSDDARRRYVQVAGHELAHQWFGDLVTPAFWDDLWLNESFATWMEEKVMATFSPAWQLRVPVILERSEALDLDGNLTARRIHQPIASRDDIATAFDTITYQKGASVLRMFEAWIGATDFQTGVRQYLADHAWGSGSTADFIAAIDAATPLDVGDAMRGYLDQNGAPRVTATMRCEKKAAPVVTLAQERWMPRGASAPAGDPQRWTVPVCIAYGNAKTRQQTCTVLTGATAEVTLDYDKGRCPAWFLPNAGGRGYYRSSLDAEALRGLLRYGWVQLPPHERMLVAGDVAAAVERGELPLGAQLDLAALLARDGTRFTLRYAADAADFAFQLADDTQRAALRGWIHDVFARKAKKLGFLPDKGDGVEQETVRAIVLGLAGGVGEDADLRKRAVELAAKWRTLPDSARGNVLAVAAIASADVRAELLGVVKKPADVRELEDAVAALSAIDDPAVATEVLGVLLDPAVDLKDALDLLFAYGEDARTQPAAETFLRAHLDELLPRVPESRRASLVEVLTGSCDAGRRAEIETYARTHFESFEGGTRTVAQALESLDRCAAANAAARPELADWLGKR